MSANQTLEFNRVLSVKELINNPNIIASLGFSEYMTKVKLSEKKMIIEEPLFYMIQRSHLTCNFVLTELPSDIVCVNLLLRNLGNSKVNSEFSKVNSEFSEFKVIERKHPAHGIVRFNSFAYAFDHDPLIFGKQIKFTFQGPCGKRRKKKKKAQITDKHCNQITDKHCNLLFDSISIPKYLWNFLKTNKVYSKCRDAGISPSKVLSAGDTAISSSTNNICYSGLLSDNQSVRDISEHTQSEYTVTFNLDENNLTKLEYATNRPKFDDSNLEEYESNLKIKKMFEL